MLLYKIVGLVSTDNMHYTRNIITYLVRGVGVYYVQCDEEDSGLTFVNKNLDSNWPYSSRSEPNEYNSSVNTFQPQTGTLILFPSYLNHKVEQQTTENERVTIAFNFGVVPNEG